MRSAILLSLACWSAHGLDLARPAENATQLSSSPSIWLTRNFLSSDTVWHMIASVPKNESAYMPCIGQVEEFESKRCTMLLVAGDPIIEAALAKIGNAWNMDMSRIAEGGLPIIRYLPGAPPVGKHGDEDRHGVVPNATLVIYLTNGDGQTIFPEADVAVTPQLGSVLSFQNVDDTGLPHPLAKHLVSAVPKEASGDRLVIQIPISYSSAGEAYAYPEHVSGDKKPGEHEFLHGSAKCRAAAQAAMAAGFGIAVVYMAAKACKFEKGDVPALIKAAKDTGAFTADDFKKKE